VSLAVKPLARRCRPWGRRFAAYMLIAIRHSSGWILRVFLTLLILGMVLFAYLHRIGFPAYVTDAFLDRMADAGYYLQIERLTLELDRGLAAHDIRIFARPESADPFLTAASFTVALDPVVLWRERRLVPVIAIDDGTLQAVVGARGEDNRQSRTLRADQIHFRFSSNGPEILLRDFSARFLGVDFRGRGAAYLAPMAGAPKTPAQNPLTAVLQVIEEAPASLLSILDEIQAIDFRAPPSADFAFTLYQKEPANNAVSFKLRNPEGVRIRDVDFDQLRVDLAWQNQRLHVTELSLLRHREALNLSGWLCTTGQTIFVQAMNTLPVSVFLDFMPGELRDPVIDMVGDVNFPIRADVQIGPVAMAKALEQVAGRIRLSRARILDIPIEALDLSFALDGKALRLLPSTAQLDSGPAASRLSAREGFFQLDTGRFEAQVEGSFNPLILRPVMTPNMRNIAAWFEIHEPLTGSVTLGGMVGNPAIYCFGPVVATNIAIRGVPIQSLDGALNITNEVMHITGATLTRPEGMARGEAHLAFSNQTLRLDVDSGLAPRATTRMLGPEVEAFMEPFQLNGPARIQASGLLDYANFSLNQLQGHVQAERFGYTQWEADTAMFDIEVAGRRIRITNATATAYGGTVSGHGVVYPVGGDRDWRYEADLAAANVRLNDFLTASFERPMGELRGTFNGTGRLGGYVGPGTGPTVAGTGDVDIREGLLFQTKLFSGLSTILSKVFPDFHLFAQTDARGSYAIRNSRVYSRDIMLEGSLFSAKGSGHTTFQGDLNYRVEVQALRGGPVAALVRLATRPVTRLLEFRLTGTFDDPKWRPVNLNLGELFE